MSTFTNRAAFLDKAGAPLVVRDAPMPIAGDNEIVVRNFAVAINPLDCHMQDLGVFVQQWPAVFGCDIAGEVHEVGAGVTRFKKGDRVIAHAINLVTGRNEHGAYALYTAVLETKTAILPQHLSYTDGVVVPFALEAAVCALSLKVPGEALPGVPTPALGLPFPTVGAIHALRKVLVVYGASSSSGSMVTQIASRSGLEVVAIAGSHNFNLAADCGASTVVDRKDDSLVEKIVAAIKQTDGEFVGIFDAISSPETYAHDLEILGQLGGGDLVCTHPPPPQSATPGNVRAGMIFAVNDIADAIFQDFVTPALDSGELKCLPPSKVVGNGLEFINEGIKQCAVGVSGTKLVVQL